MKLFDPVTDEIYMVVQARTDGTSPKLCKTHNDQFYYSPSNAWDKASKLNDEIGHKLYTVMAFTGSTTGEFESSDECDAHEYMLCDDKPIDFTTQLRSIFVDSEFKLVELSGGRALFIEDGTVYSVTVMPGSFENPMFSQVDSLYSSISILENHSKYASFLSTWRKALDEFCLGVHKTGNAAHLCEPLKNHLLSIL